MTKDVIAYIRVSTGEQADSGAGLDAQKAAIAAEAARRGWHIIETIEDVGSGKDLKRPGIIAALEALRDHRASTLVVAKLDRLSRSMMDLAGLMATATREHWALVALDLGVDTTTPAGEAMASVMGVFAQFERRLIGQRTREALAQKRLAGVRLGRPRRMPDDVLERIVAARKSGRTLASIAEELTAEGVPTTSGGRAWYASTVRAALMAAKNDDDAAANRRR